MSEFSRKHHIILNALPKKEDNPGILPFLVLPPAFKALHTDCVKLYQYLDRVNTIIFPLSTPEKESCLQAIHEGDDAAMITFFIHHLRYVVACIAQTEENPLPILPLITAGNLGLLQAIQEFNPHRHHDFTRFALRTIPLYLEETMQPFPDEALDPPHRLSQQLQHLKYLQRLILQSTQTPIAFCYDPIFLSALLHLPYQQVEHLLSCAHVKRQGFFP